MKKIVVLIGFMAGLTGCPTQQEVKNMTEGVAVKRNEAVSRIQSRDFSLEGLMKAQEYFFDFSEKVHLIKVEAAAQQNMQRLIKKDGARKFCESFVMPLSYWQTLESYCANGTFYKCSPEIKEYGNTLAQFKQLAGAGIALALANEASCN
jgi:hypothetical protein